MRATPCPFIAVLALLTATPVLAQQPAAAPGLAALEQRATLVADINEIKRLQRIYGYYIDRSDWDNVVDLLTDDATAEYGSSGIYAGKAHIRALLYGIGYGKRGLQPQQIREHIQLQPVVHVSADGSTAKGRWFALVLLGQFQQYGRWQTGPYENEYRKEGGKWKISKLRWSETFTVPYEGGWTTSMPQSNVADRRLPPPDRPATSTAKPWPTVQLLPYHYAGPQEAALRVTGVAGAASKTAGVDAATLQRRVERLEDERDVEILQRTYGYYVDKNLWQPVSELFADDATLEIGGRGVFVGRKRILEYLRFLGSPAPGRLYDHTQMQPVVNVSPDGTRAKGRWRALIFVGEPSQVARLGDAIYENEYVKEGGKWKIAKLHAWFLMYSEIDKGWGKSAMPNTRPEKDMPPDRPPTVVYDMYPGTLAGPFHYENPVTGRPVFAAATAAPAKGAVVALPDLERRLGALEDVQSIENLQSAYGFYIDKWQWDEAAQLFSADGRIELGQRGVYRGRERVRRSFELAGPAGLRQGEVNDHIQYQPVIHVAADGRTAQARVREFQMLGKFGGTASIGAGVQENEYVKEGGVWRIRSLHQYQTFMVGYGKRWIEGAQPMQPASTTVPPDAPPTQVYRTFPEFFIPPFHYVSPVTGLPPVPR